MPPHMIKQPRPTASWPFIGQEKLGGYLLDGLRTKQLPSALLFSGPKALGKTTAAIWLSRVSLCRASTPRPCEQCVDCRQSLNLIHPRQVIVQSTEHGRISIEAIRDALHRFLITSAPNEERWVLIPDAEQMTEPAANTLLKFLEELPSQTRAILTTAQPAALLPTLRSRLTTLYWHLVPAATLRRSIDQPPTTVQRAAGRPGWLALEASAWPSIAPSLFGQLIEHRPAASATSASPTTDKQSTQHLLDDEELVVRELLLTVAGSKRRNLWPDKAVTTSDLAARIGLARLLNLAERYLERHTYSLNIQPRLLYEDLHLV